jgi:hypothetical protein
VKLNLSGLCDDLVCIAGISGGDFGLLEVDVIVMVEPMFWHCKLTRLSEPCVLVVFFHLGLSGLTGLSNAD